MNEPTDEQDGNHSPPERKDLHDILVIPPEHEARLDEITDGLKHRHSHVLCAMERTIVLALEIGEFLNEVMALVPRGNFEAWVEIHAPFGLRQAQRYMQALDQAKEMGIDPKKPRQDGRMPNTIAELLGDSEKSQTRHPCRERDEVQKATSATPLGDSHADEVSDPRLADAALSNPRKPSANPRKTADTTEDENPHSRDTDPGDHDQYVDSDYSPPPSARTPESATVSDAARKTVRSNAGRVVVEKWLIESLGVLEDDFPTLWEHAQNANDFLEAAASLTNDSTLNYRLGREMASVGASSAGLTPEDFDDQLVGVIEIAGKLRKTIKPFVAFDSEKGGE